MANKSFHFNGIQAILTDVGLPVGQANTIATASQAVDDFHQETLIVFDDGKLFYPVVTAHRMLDSDNIDSRDASNVWMPFHFFPDNDGVCRPDTPNVDRLIDYVAARIRRDDGPQVQRDIFTGILLHIVVDTYTHQGFMGLYCRHNDISQLDDENEIDFGFIGNIPPAIGHGEALSYPDDSWREWRYKDSYDQPVFRDNKAIFMAAALKIREVLIRLGFDADTLVQIDPDKYRPVFASKADHAEQFDAITGQNNPDGVDISYKVWRDKTLRGVKSADNVWIKKDPDRFDTSEWYLFQACARDIRGFFKQEVFPKLCLRTKVY